MEKERERTIKKDLRMQMENRERKRERESTRIESRRAALTSKRAKRERVSENGKDGGGEGPDTRDGDARGKEATRVRLRGEERGPRAERRGRESDGKNQ